MNVITQHNVGRRLRHEELTAEEWTLWPLGIVMPCRLVTDTNVSEKLLLPSSE
jgi:hypothetical protein